VKSEADFSTVSSLYVWRNGPDADLRRNQMQK